MNTAANLKRKLLAIALTMVMAVSCLFGVLFIRANAESVNTTDLISVSNGASVEASKKYTLKNEVSGNPAGTQVGQAGLYVNAPEDPQADYTVDFNGVFTGSFGMKIHFPNEGYWNHYKKAVFTVTSATDSSVFFTVTLERQYQQWGYVNYIWNGQTLWRTANSYADSSTLYYTESGCKNAGSAQYGPFMGHYSDSNGGWKEGYLGIEMQEDGAINVVLYSTHNMLTRKVVASFADDPETFEPTTEESGTEPNLPKLDFSGGYTISLTVSDTYANDNLDFLVDSFAESETGDPYEVGTVYSMENAVLDTAPAFYTRWQNVPTISVDGSSIAVSPVGEELTLPVATYTTPAQTEPQTVTDISYKFDGEQSFTPAEGGKFTPDKLGEYTVRYAVTANETQYYKDITFIAREFPESALETSDLVSVSGATVETATQYKETATGTPLGEQGMLFTAQDSTQNYAIDVVGVFTGSTTMEWAAPGEDWNVSGVVTFTVAELGNSENSFQVIWQGPYQTTAYVKYNYPGRDGVEAQQLVRASNGDYTSYKMGTSHNKEEGQVGDNWFLQCKPFLNNWNDSNQRAPGVLSLEWQLDGSLNVVVLRDNGNRHIIASFCDDPATFVPSTAVYGEGGKDYNLPKLSFENGYTISVEVTGNTQFMLYDISETGEQPDSVSVAEKTIEYEPYFYSQGKQIPTFADAQAIGDVELGTEVTVPTLTYTTYSNTEAVAVTDVKWGVLGGELTAVEGGKIVPADVHGDYVVRYTVTALGVDFVKEITFHACVYETLSDTITPPACNVPGEGWYSCEHGNMIVKEIPALTHDYGEATWSWDGYTSATASFKCSHCGDVQTVKAEGASITSEVTKSATCYEEGVRTYTATVTFGDEQFTDTKTEVIDMTAHVYGEPEWTWEGYTGAKATFACTNGGCMHSEEVTAEITSAVTKEATCYEKGVRTYTATVTFGEEEYTDTKTEEIAMTAHAYGEPTWAWTGYESAKATFACTNGGCAHTEEVTAEITSAVTKEATCTETGVKTYTAKATLDEKQYTTTKEETLAALGHDLTHHDAVAATCEENGNVEYWSCSRCGKNFADEDGSEELENVVIPAIGHVYGEPTWTWTGYESAKATFACTNSGCTHTEEVTAEITSTVTKEATCYEKGVRTYTATVMFSEEEYTDTKTEEIEMTVHVYGEPTWSWEGYTGAKATFVCTNDGCTHTEDVTAEITSAVTKEATCTETGVKVYTATVTFDGETYTSTKTEIVEAHGHTVVKVDAKAPTCTEAGNGAYYTCEECGGCWSDPDAQNATSPQNMVVPATGHKYENGVCTVCGAEDPDYVAEDEGGCSSTITYGGAVIAAAGILAAAAAVTALKRRKDR